MKPDFNAGLTFVNASYESIHGLIKSNWKKDKKGLNWTISIPANTSALVYLPTTDSKKITVNKGKLEKTGIEHKTDGNQQVLNLPSGEYSIIVK